jgi:hypothetical protein
MSEELITHSYNILKLENVLLLWRKIQSVHSQLQDLTQDWLNGAYTQQVQYLFPYVERDNAWNVSY